MIIMWYRILKIFNQIRLIFILHVITTKKNRFKIIVCWHFFNRLIFFIKCVVYYSIQNHKLYQSLCRKKTFTDEVEPGKEKLKRVLNIFDLTALGIGATLGCGVYVLAGTVAKSIAGPAVVLSFIVAAIVSSFSGTFWISYCTVRVNVSVPINIIHLYQWRFSIPQ